MPNLSAEEYKKLKTRIEVDTFCECLISTLLRCETTEEEVNILNDYLNKLKIECFLKYV